MRHWWVVGWLWCGCACAGKPSAPDAADMLASEPAPRPNTPKDTEQSSTSGQPDAPRSAPTTGSLANESISTTTLTARGPFGSGQEMLDLVGAHRIASLRGPEGDAGLALELDVAHRQAARGEAWLILEREPSGVSTARYLVVPVTLTVRSHDGRIDQTWDNAELVTGERDRVSLEHTHEGALAGSLGWNDLPTLEPPCLSLFVTFDFRAGEMHARVAFENASRMKCLEWQTEALPVFWRVIDGA